MSVGGQSSADRRSIEELRTRYLLEPELGDIYVEGMFDVRLISWFLSVHRRHWKVYSIESVDVPADKVLAEGFDNGARGRVLTLGGALETSLYGGRSVGPLCIADRDFDTLLHKQLPGGNLCLVTDFKSMELYGYNVKVIDKLLELFLHARGVKANEVVRALNPALIDLGLLRAVLHRGRYGIALLDDVTGCCTIGSVIGLNMRELLRRSIDQAYSKSPGHAKPDAAAILAEVEELRSLAPQDPRFVIHEDDFIRLLTWYLKPYVRGSDFHKPEVVGRALVSCFEAVDLAQHSLFAEILRRTAT